MNELAKRFIGQECIIYTITSNDGSVQGVIKEVTDSGEDRRAGNRQSGICHPHSGVPQKEKREKAERGVGLKQSRKIRNSYLIFYCQTHIIISESEAFF